MLMFTGIVEEMGTVRRLNQAPNRCELELTASKVLAVSYTHLTLPTKLEV